MQNPRVVTLILCLVLFSLSAHAQEGDPVGAWQVVVNQARLGVNLAPYGFSRLLTEAAQRHADDVAANGFADPGDVHMGSDGTHEQERVADAGYPAWSWIGGGLIVDENMWSGYGTVEDAMAWFMGSTVHRDNILSPRYREVGIGVASDADGRSYYVLVFGVRPNVLPVFINDGAASADSPEIAIRLTNEEARPDGEGATFMGRAIEVRINDESRFDDLPWQPWDTYVSWTLPATPGEHTVYVQFRDAAGRTAESADSIVLNEGASNTPEPVPPPTSTPEPTATPIPPSPTPEPTATPVPTSTPTVVPTPTPTPEPVVTVEPTATPDLLPTPVPSRTPATVSTTPFPTWTPLPTPAPQEPNDPALPLGVLGVLQGTAIVLGIYLALRRGRGVASQDEGAI